MGIKPTSKIIILIVYLQSITKYNIVLVHMVVLRIHSAKPGIESKLTKKDNFSRHHNIIMVEIWAGCGVLKKSFTLVEHP